MSEADPILGFEERTVEVDGEARTVLVAQPVADIWLDAARLERLRRDDFTSRIDFEIMREVGQRPDPPAVVIFDARDASGERRWGFDPDLDDEQRMEFGRRLLRSQIALYRELIERRTAGLVGVGFGPFELAAFQRGTVRVVTDLSSELEDADPSRAAEIEVELWLIEHAARWTGLPLEEFLGTTAAEEIMERNRKRSDIEALLAAGAGASGAGAAGASGAGSPVAPASDSG